MRKLGSLPGKGIFSLQGKSLSGHSMVAVASSLMEKPGTALACQPTSGEKKGLNRAVNHGPEQPGGLLDILAGRKVRSFCDQLQACSCPFAELLKSLNQI